MNLKTSSGLTLAELLVIMASTLGFFVSLPCCITSDSVMKANMTAVGVRGRDIYVAVTAANVEREAVGLPPLWPRDFDPAVDTNGTAAGEHCG